MWNFLQIKKKLIYLSGILKHSSSKGIQWLLKEPYLEELDDLFSASSSISISQNKEPEKIMFL